MLAVMTMCGKIPARSKVRNLFDLFDEDLDGKLNSAEAIMMLRFDLAEVIMVLRFDSAEAVMLLWFGNEATTRSHPLHGCLQ